MGNCEGFDASPKTNFLSLNSLNEYNKVGVFFIDATFLPVLKRDDPFGYEKVRNQIQKMVSQGCSVELHLHPQGLDSLFDKKSKTWSFKSFDRYRLNALSEEDLNSLFTECFKELEGIIKDVNPCYELTSFRAGGWSISPFELLKTVFLKNGIKYDFSVIPGEHKKELPKHYYDFRNVPRDHSYWRFENDVCSPLEDGRFVEFPVGIQKFTRFDLVKNKYMIRSHRFFGDGEGLAEKTGLVQRVRQFLNPGTRSFTFDAVGYDIFCKYLRSLPHDDINVLVSHPKTITENGLKSLNIYVSIVKC